MLEIYRERAKEKGWVAGRWKEGERELHQPTSRNRKRAAADLIAQKNEEDTDYTPRHTHTHTPACVLRQNMVDSTKIIVIFGANVICV